MTTATVRTLDDAVVADLEAIMNEPGSVLTNISSRTNRARVPAPFPVHRWGEYVPAAVVLPRTAQQVSEIVKLATRCVIVGPGISMMKLNEERSKYGGVPPRSSPGLLCVRPFWARPGKRAPARVPPLLGRGRQRLKSDPSTSAYLGIVERAG
jgi:hypothetical protein